MIARNKRVLGAVGVALLGGVVVSGAACWKTLRNGTFTDSACGTGAGFTLTATFVPAYDFAELRETSGDSTFRVLESSGTRCVSEACDAALSAASSQSGWSNGSNGRLPGHRYVVAMRGENAFVIDQDKLRLGAALAPIDTPQKAAAVASIDRNLGVRCEPSVRKVESGFEVHLSTSSCFGPRDEVIGVAVNGETKVISSESGPSTCVGQRLDLKARHIEPKYAAVTPTK